MAKLSFSKLGLKENIDNGILTINEQTIEVKNYLPLKAKLDIIANIVNKSWDPQANFYNPCQYKVLIDFELIKNYTNIIFTQKQEEDFYKTYDLLDSNDLIYKIKNLIPKKEIEFITNGVVDAIQAIYQYEHSVYGILNNIKEDYNNLDLDASKIQKELADPENMDLLKAVLAKLG